MGTSTLGRGKRVANQERAAARVAHLTPLDSYEHPGVGLAPDALRNAWPAEPAAKWDDVRLAQLAEAAIGVWSYLIATIANERKTVATLARQVALTATVGWVVPEPAGTPAAEAALRAPYAAAGWKRVAEAHGWGGGLMAWRKLVAYGPIPLELDAGISLPHELRLENEWDYRSFDRACEKVLESVTGRLPAPIVTAFLAGPRRIDDTHVPGVLEATALALSWGPFGGRRAMLRSLQMQGETAGRRTLLNYASMLDSLVAAAREVSGRHLILPELGWHEHWTSLKKKAGKITTRNGEGNTRDTTSPGMMQTRRACGAWERRLDSHRRRDGSLRPSGRQDLFRVTLQAVHISASCRIGMTALIAPRHVVRSGTVGDYTGPLVWVTPNKNRPLLLEPRPVHVTVVDYVDEYCDELGIPRHDERPLWRARNGQVLDKGSLVREFSRRESKRMPALVFRPDGRPASSHTSRSTGDQAIRAITAAIVLARPELAGRIDPEAAADVWLSHKIRSDRLGYRDVENNRIWWAVRIGAGDPEYGIPGLGDLLFGDAGARKGWDIEAIRETVQQRETARAGLSEVNRQIAAVSAEEDRVLGQPIRVVPRALASMAAGKELLDELGEPRPVSTHDLARVAEVLTQIMADSHAVQIDLATEVAETHDARERERARFSAELGRLRDLRVDRQVDLERAGLQLERLEERGRRLPLPDELPTTGELRAATGDPSARAVDEEPWQDALARAGGASPAATRRVRKWMSNKELTIVLGSDDTTVLRMRKGQTASEIGRGIRRATWVEIGAKLAFVDASTLPLHLFLPSQRELLDTILGEPMGSFGGRRRSDAELDEALRKQREAEPAHSAA